VIAYARALGQWYEELGCLDNIALTHLQSEVVRNSNVRSGASDGCMDPPSNDCNSKEQCGHFHPQACLFSSVVIESVSFKYFKLVIAGLGIFLIRM